MKLPIVRRVCRSLVTLSGLATAMLLSGCGDSSPNEIPVIRIDGSSTVFPIAEAVAEEFQLHGTDRTRVTVGLSGARISLVRIGFSHLPLLSED